MQPTSWGAHEVDGDIPPYFFNQIRGKIGDIGEKSRKGTSFVFITDTHVKSNQMHSPKLIKYVLDKTNIHTVIWGGDAIMQYGGTIEEQWKVHLRFDSIFNKTCNFYKVRGNHDFSILSKKNGFPDKLLLSNEEAARLLLRNCPSDLHRNVRDSGACYYFFDNKDNKVRFIILDTTDSVPSKVRSWGNVPSVHDSQLQWIADSAVSTTPEGYDLIFVSHIPIPNKNSNKKSALRKLKLLIDEICSYSSGKIGNVKYDFTKLKDVKVLLCLAGHIHKDSEKYVNGILYLTTANDGKWKSKKSGVKRKMGSVSEQCFDCFCISKDKRIVHAYRIGFGKDRHFHVEPVKLSINKEKKINFILKGPVKLVDLNVTEKSKTKSTILNEFVSLDNEGYMKGLKKGSTTVVVQDTKGNKEFFNVIVQ